MATYHTLLSTEDSNIMATYHTLLSALPTGGLSLYVILFLFDCLLLSGELIVRQTHVVPNTIIMDDVDPETRNKAYNWCKEYLGGAWTKIKLAELQIVNLR